MKSYTVITSSFLAMSLRVVICSGTAKNGEVVAVDDFIDVGNIMGKSWVCLFTMHPNSHKTLIVWGNT